MTRSSAALAATLTLWSSVALAQNDAPPPLPGSTSGAPSESEAPPPPPPLVDAPAETNASAPNAQPRAGTSTRRAPDDAAAPKRMNRVTGGPLSVFVGAVTLEYERALTDRFSFFIGPRIGYTGLGIGGSTGVRFFPLPGEAPMSGLWLGPELFAEFRASSGSTNGVAFASTGLTGIGLAMIGYTYIGPSGWTISIGGGFGAGWNQESGTGVVTQPNGAGGFTSSIGRVDRGGLIPSLASHLNVGYAF